MIPILMTVLAAVAQAPADAGCQPIAGAESVTADRTMRWLIVGETHGTSETPAIFADLVCLVAASGRRAVIALEYPVDQQPQIGAFLASNGNQEARAALLGAPMWHERMPDGRASRAMFDLLERLRQLKRAKRIDGVVAFKPHGALDTQAYEQAMADRVKSASPTSKALVIALVGNTHARTAKWTSFGGETYMPMAGLLPRLQTITLAATGNGGAQWACFLNPRISADRSPARTTCGARDFGPSPRPQARSLVPTRQPDAPYSGMLYLGVPTTASPPAASN